MKRLIFIFLILILSCKEKTKTKEIEIEEITQAEFKLAESDFVIFPYQTDWYWIFKDVKPTKLSKSELIEIENILNIAIIKNNQTQKTESGFELILDGFKRQYVPVTNKKGQKEVWINFFCNDFGGKYWKTDLVQVDDGGNCFFSLKINLETKEYYELSINGYA